MGTEAAQRQEQEQRSPAPYSSEDFDEAVIAQLIPGLVRTMYTGALSTAVFSVLLFSHAPRALGAWIVLRAVTSVHTVKRLRLLASPTGHRSTAQRLSSITSVMTLSSVVWALVAVVIHPEEPQWRAVVALWIFGHHAVSMVVCSPHRQLAQRSTMIGTLVGCTGMLLPADSFAVVLASLVMLSGVYSLIVGQGLSRIVLAGVRSRLELATATAALAARQVELEQTNGKLHQLAQTDELTQLPNRRKFYTTAAPEGLTEQDGWIGLIDVDGFKQINDTHGHAMGDRVLQALALAWVPLLDGCQLARLGGDEFAFVSFASSAEQIDRIAATLTAAAGQLAKIDCGVVAPTVSIGLAPFNAGADLSAVLATADAALYRAKSGGRNCVCVAASQRGTGEMPTAQSPLLGR